MNNIPHLNVALRGRRGRGVRFEKFGYKNALKVKT
jgi:hypothetical protein